MRKLLLSLTLALAFASSASAQLSIGLGYTGDNKTWSIIGENVKTNFNGFYVGADYTVCHFGPIDFTPGLYLSFLGKTYKEPLFAGFSWVGKFSEININIPVNFSYGIDFSDSVRGFIYAGPTFLVGLSSQFKSTGEKKSSNIYSKQYGYSRFNILLGGGIGVDFAEKLRVSVGYNAGVINRDLNRTLNGKITEGGFHAGIAYLF